MYAALGLLCALVPVPAQGAASFNDPQGRFSVQVPAGWTATPLNNDALQLWGGGPYVSVIVLPNDDPAQAIDAISRQTATQWRGFTEARRGDTRISGLAGKYVTYSGMNPRGVDCYLELLAVFHSGNTYLLMMVAPKAQFASVKPALDQIEQSFTLSAGTVAPPAPAGVITPSQAISSPPADSPSTVPAAGNNYYRMKKVSVIDTQGFQKPMPAVSLLIPADWQFQGETKYTPTVGGCHENTVQISFRATSPDGRMAIEMFPSYVWVWSDDANSAQLLQTVAQQAARFGKPCEVLPAMSAGEYLRRMVLPKSRPNHQVVAVEQMPDVMQQSQQQAREYEQTAARMGMPTRVRADAGRAHLQYNLNGQAVEEWVTAVTYAAGVPGPSFNPRTGQMGQTTYYSCGAYFVMAMRAPAGQLAAMEKFFTMVRSTVQTEPEWQAGVTQMLQTMSANDTKGAADRSAIITQNGREISDIRKQTYDNTTKSREHSAAQFDQYVRGVATYRNPATGETFELSNQYGHAWVNGANEYVLTDSPGFNPNATLSGHWTEAQPVK